MKLEYLKARQKLTSFVHEFFQSRDYMSIDAPVMVLAPGTEVHLDYFATAWEDHRAGVHRLYLRSSPELHLKQAMASFGLERVYHLGKCFRNKGEISAWHHPEFTMLEFYQAGISLEGFMQLTEEFVAGAFSLLGRSLGGVSRISMYEAFDRWASIELIDGDETFAARAIAAGHQSVRADDDFETAYFKVLIDAVEPGLARERAVFVYDFPPTQAALANIRDGRAKRFELYLDGVELCNAFDELVDPLENRRRLTESNRLRAEIGKFALPADEDFLRAMEAGMPAACGNALGFDRLLAVGLGLPGIGEVVPFRGNRPFLEGLVVEGLDGF